MRLNDIWRNVHKEIGFYTKETFSNVPASPGIYAWFYPLRITTVNIESFLDEVSKIQNYDALIDDRPIKRQFVDFTWKKIRLDIALQSSDFKINHVKYIWEEAVSDERKFDNLRKIIMKSSILLPPLYVGKTINLNLRCSQHRNGNDKRNSFHKRFCNFANKHKVRAQEVSDLLFVCINTIEETKADQNIYVNNLESLVEEMLKTLSRPVYSVK